MSGRMRIERNRWRPKIVIGAMAIACLAPFASGAKAEIVAQERAAQE